MKSKILIAHGWALIRIFTRLFTVGLCVFPIAASASDELVISMEVTGECNRCQNFKLDIFENGVVIFEGRKNTRVNGKNNGSITMRQLGEIRQGFLDIGFFDLAREYPQPKGLPPDLVSHVETRLYFKYDRWENSVLVHALNSPGTPPGFKLIGNLIKRLSGARKWACPAVVSLDTTATVCDFPE